MHRDCCFGRGSSRASGKRASCHLVRRRLGRWDGRESGRGRWLQWPGHWAFACSVMRRWRWGTHRAKTLMARDRDDFMMTRIVI